MLKQRIHLTTEALMKAFDEEWLYERFTNYHQAMGDLDADSGDMKLGKLIVENFGGDTEDITQALKAYSSFALSLKHVGKFLDNFKIK